MKRRRVIDAIAHVADHMTAPLESGDDPVLLPWGDTGEDVGLVDGCRQVTGRLVATLWREVSPKNAVVDVASQVEGEVLLQLVDPGKIVLFASFG